MKLEKEIQDFAERIGAVPQESGRYRSLFTYEGSFMIIKISRTPKPFLGVGGKILDTLLSMDSNFYCVFLVNEIEGWLYNKKDVQRMVQSKRWKKDTKGEYKINPPHEDRLQFGSVEKFKLLIEMNQEAHRH